MSSTESTSPARPVPIVPPPARATVAAPLAAFEILAHRLDAGADPAFALSVFEAASVGHTDPIVAFTRAASRLGVRLRPVHQSPRQVSDGGDAAVDIVPAVSLRSASSRAPWVVVDERRGARLQVTEIDEGGVASEPRWLDGAGLAAVLGVSPEEPVAWQAAEPQAPLDNAVRGADGSPPPSDHSGSGDGHGDGGDHGHDHQHAPPHQRLLALLRAERHDVRVAVVYASAVGVMSLAVPVTVQALVNTVAFGALLQPLVVLALLLLGALVLGGVMRALQAFTIEVIQQRIFARLSLDLAWRLPRARLDSLDREHGPELVNRFFDVFTVQKGVAILLTDGFAVVLQTGIAMVVLAFYHPVLLAFDVALMAGIAVVLLLGRGATPTAIDESRAKYHVAEWLEEMVRHPVTFKSEGGADWALRRAEALTRRYVARRRRHFRVVLRQIIASNALQAIASASLLGVGGWLVIARQLTLGQLVAAELIVSAAVAGVLKFGKYLENYYDLLAAVDKLGHLIDLPLESARGAPLSSTEGAPGPAALRLAEVRYTFPGTHTERLRGASITLAPGDRLVVEAAPGEGKTTLVELCYGLREPTGGHLELDGIDLRQLALEQLRSRVALVRGIEVFGGTVAENVRVGRPVVSDAEVREALMAVGLWDAVCALPGGVDTTLVTDGAPLSEGQARLLCFARAIAGRPRLLVVDDGFAFVEPLAAGALARTLFDRERPWTLLFAGEVDPRLVPGARWARLEGGQLVERDPASVNGSVTR